MRDPLRGNIFENYVVMDIIKELYHYGDSPNVYFLRDSKGFDVDLVLEMPKVIKLIEIKSSMIWNREFHKNLIAAQNLFSKPVELYLVYGGSQSMTVDTVHIIPATDVRRIVYADDR